MKKLLATLLTVTMLGSVSVPALAAEQPADTSGSANTTYPADEANTPYDQGYDDGYKLGYEKGEALCKQDIAAGTVTYAPDYNYSEGSETYEDGLTDGTIDGMDDGYTATFEYHYHMDYWTAVELLDKGGTVGQINVLVDATCLNFENGPWPVLFQGTTMVPVRTVMEALGANVAYAQTAKTITVTKGDTVVTLTLGSPQASVEKDGKTETATLTKAPYIAQANGVYSTMVPVRFVSEAWGTTVLWDDDHRTVVLADTAGLIAEMDQNFTVFNQILQAQQQTFAGKKLVQTMQATGQLTLYDEAGKATDYAVSADAKTYSDGKAQRMQATLNMESALKALAKSHPEILDQVQVSLGTLLRTDLKRIPVDFLMDETGGCSLSTPLFHLFFPQLFAEASWFHVTDLDPTVLSLAQKGGSIGEILSQSVASVSPFDYYDTLAQSAKAMSALFRDDLAQKGGNTYTWKLNNAVLNGLLGVTDDNGITDGALEDTMVLDGFLTTDTKGNATVQLSLDLKTGDQPQERIGLRFRLAQSTSTTSTLPSLTLPEGADVQEFMGVGSVL